MDFDQFGTGNFDPPLEKNDYSANHSSKIDFVPSTEPQPVDLRLGMDDPFPEFGNFVLDRAEDRTIQDTETVTATSTSAGSPPVEGASTCSGSCLLQAISLLKQLFTNLSASCSQSPTRNTTDDNDSFVPSHPRLEAIISKNKETIETVNTILSCPCSQDAYLLAIMTLIVFKVINWYSAIARDSDPIQRPLQRRHSIGGSMDDIGQEEHGRIAGQLILGELHCVQRLVSQLSHRLKADSVRSSIGQPLPDVDGSTHKANPDGWVPFSPAMLDQLEADLRKGLRTLFSEIVSMLRRV